MKTPKSKPEFIPPYEGNDMASYMMKEWFPLHDKLEAILNITNIRDTAIIVTDRGVWRARPEYQIGFCIELLVRY